MATLCHILNYGARVGSLFAAPLFYDGEFEAVYPAVSKCSYRVKMLCGPHLTMRPHHLTRDAHSIRQTDMAAAVDRLKCENIRTHATRSLRTPHGLPGTDTTASELCCIICAGGFSVRAALQ